MVPARETELAELTRDYTTLQQIYSDLLAKNEESKVAANLERRQIGEQFKLLDPARLPEKPISPNRLMINLIGRARRVRCSARRWPHSWNTAIPLQDRRRSRRGAGVCRCSPAFRT